MALSETSPVSSCMIRPVLWGGGWADLVAPATGRRRAAVGPQPWPLGHREPEPPPPGHDLRRRCLSDAHRPRTLQQRHRQPHGARHHLPSRLPPSPSRSSALCHGSGRSDPRGRRARLRAFPEPSPIPTPPTVPPTLRSFGWVPAVAAPSEPKRVPSGRTRLDVDGHQHRITPLPQPRILENLPPLPKRPGEHATNDKHEMTLRCHASLLPSPAYRDILTG